MYDRKHTYSIIANINMLIQLTHFINVVDYNYCMAKLRSKSESLWACIQMIYCILYACFFNKHTNIDSNFQRDRIIKPQIILPFLIFPSCKLGYLYYHRHHMSATVYPPEQVALQFGGSKNLSNFFSAGKRVKGSLKHLRRRRDADRLGGLFLTSNITLPEPRTHLM